MAAVVADISGCRMYGKTLLLDVISSPEFDVIASETGRALQIVIQRLEGLSSRVAACISTRFNTRFQELIDMYASLAVMSAGFLESALRHAALFQDSPPSPHFGFRPKSFAFGSVSRVRPRRREHQFSRPEDG